MNVNVVVPLLALTAILTSIAGCGSPDGDDDRSPTPVAVTAQGTPPETPVPTHPRGTRAGIESVDRVLDAVESGDADAVTELLLYLPQPCNVVIRDAGDQPQCREGEAQGTAVDVFPENKCEGEPYREDHALSSLRSLESKRLYAVYRGGRIGPEVDYQIVFWPGGMWGISDGRITEINVGCGYPSPANFVSGWQLTDAVLEPR